MEQDFWDETWSSFEPFTIDPATLIKNADPCDKMFLDLVGEVNGKSVLDVGCGNGVLSVYLAKNGARVTAIDNSKVAIDNTIALAGFNQVRSLLEPYCLNSTELGKLGKSFDLVVGKYILHHIEPFDLFTDVLFNVMTEGGRGVFLENNSRNLALMFFRKFCAGRFGIPKCSDDKEYPFEPREIEMLKKRFDRVHLYYPVFHFLRTMNSYLFKGSRKIGNIFIKIDDWVYNHLAIFHKYSYRQIIEVRKS